MYVALFKRVLNMFWYHVFFQCISTHGGSTFLSAEGQSSEARKKTLNDNYGQQHNTIHLFRLKELEKANSPWQNDNNALKQ